METSLFGKRSIHLIFGTDSELSIPLVFQWNTYLNLVDKLYIICRFSKPKKEPLIAIMEKKRGFAFLGSETQKIINCHHVIVQRVVSLLFPVTIFSQTTPNKRNQFFQDSRTELRTQYIKDLPRENCARNKRKVNVETKTDILKYCGQNFPFRTDSLFMF